ncbi:uncharacterized protein N7446_010774 [Penicillium canescens]|uniref:Uncharacterized protein n=1 Tax=Penicillium canescens TaxID=5083 RepID=A0AAD6IBB9_PENCN|nr:uncharacterized protein N7446_010774 [Penicillium canescens]KAJ6041336.1 hypothetical protein N7460_006726 [Penicillium canescens]KAJ6050665.1 hypothetical protein N7446_010774 [Penicillium canescens]
MAVLALFLVEPDDCSEDEAEKVLKDARSGIRKAVEQKNLQVRWLVMGFPLGIGPIYSMEVLFDGPPELLDGVPRGKPGVTGDPI